MCASCWQHVHQTPCPTQGACPAPAGAGPPHTVHTQPAAPLWHPGTAQHAACACPLAGSALTDTTMSVCTEGCCSTCRAQCNASRACLHLEHSTLPSMGCSCREALTQKPKPIITQQQNAGQGRAPTRKALQTKTTSSTARTHGLQPRQSHSNWFHPHAPLPPSQLENLQWHAPTSPAVAEVTTAIRVSTPPADPLGSSSRACTPPH